MSLIPIFAAAMTVIWLAERSVEHLKLAVAALCFCAAVLLLVVSDFERAILLSSILAAAIFGASRVKYKHSGLKLIVTDLPLAFAGTVPFFVVQYPLAVAAVLAGGIALMLAAVAVLLYAGGPPVSLEFRVLLFGIACIGLGAAYKASGGPFLSSASWRSRGVSIRPSRPRFSTRFPGGSSAASRSATSQKIRCR